METKTVEVDGRRVTVSRATVRQGMARTRLISEGLEAGETDPDRRLLRRFTYPDCVAAAVSAAGVEPWPPDFETFLTLPDDFCAQWEAAVYALNLHWMPGYEPSPKASAPANSTSG